MATRLADGQLSWSGSRDKEGHRTYKVTHRVQTDAPGRDGPAQILQTAGLPQPGDEWQFDNDADIWAFCTPEADIEAEDKERPSTWWRVTQTFTTKPPAEDKRRCNTTKIEDPLLEPQKISGSFEKEKIEGLTDVDGIPITSSSWEPLRGPQNEWDELHPKVCIEQNVADLELPLVTALLQRGGAVNDAPLWGCPAGTIRLVSFEWERKFYGSCYVYFTRKFEFEIKFDTWERDILDEGAKVLNGHWDDATGNWVNDDVGGVPPDPANPTHFKRFTDREGNPMRAVLNGAGNPADVTIGTGSDTEMGGAGAIHVQYYPDGNLLSLNIPTTFT